MGSFLGFFLCKHECIELIIQSSSKGHDGWCMQRSYVLLGRNNVEWTLHPFLSDRAKQFAYTRCSLVNIILLWTAKNKDPVTPILFGFLSFLFYLWPTQIKPVYYTFAYAVYRKRGAVTLLGLFSTRLWERRGNDDHHLQDWTSTSKVFLPEHIFPSLLPWLSLGVMTGTRLLWNSVIERLTSMD